MKKSMKFIRLMVYNVQDMTLFDSYPHREEDYLLVNYVFAFEEFYERVHKYRYNPISFEKFIQQNFIPLSKQQNLFIFRDQQASKQFRFYIFYVLQDFTQKRLAVDLSHKIEVMILQEVQNNHQDKMFHKCRLLYDHLPELLFEYDAY